MPAPVESQRFYAEQRRLTTAVLVRAATLWGDRPPRDFDAWFAENGPVLTELLTRTQPEIVGRSVEYVSAVLTAQGGDITPDVDVDPTPLLGVAGDGRPIDSLLYGAVIHAKAEIGKVDKPTDLDMRAGWSESGRVALLTRMRTVLADTSRAATSLATVARPRVGYTRLLVGTSCGRCAVLAGRRYGSAAPFLRHPGCDCRHVPGRFSDLDEAAVDVGAYFRSLSPEEQDRRFTKAGAQAIRDGADPTQVVNARRGAGLDYASGRITDEERAAIRGRSKAGGTTTEGTTRRGRAYRSLQSNGQVPQRLMPEAIYQAADGDRKKALELLRVHGYATDARPSTAGSGSGPPRVPPARHGPAAADDGDQYPHLNDPRLAPTWRAEFTRRHILDGDDTGGGHRAGLGRPGKTEFPPTWTDEKVMDAVAQTVLDPGLDTTFNGRRSRIRIVDDVLIETTAFVDADGAERFSKAHPTRGRGVMVNSADGLQPAGEITERQRKRFTPGSE
ncbi:MuF-like minor capsid protein [Gordonia phage Dogfish]|nr:MuF-like minor capsid protein [Gordonia phage Dogfish]